ncbi:hypothetical protein M422DRAFT_254056 [Sphaerobolus stellatus SS14]|uniref:Uncharacterized protein n=1 Tax=Sphaerobolus stellatus (strain SS14) TaxID=990650 RepID=A0A0C9VWC0_SPHS4|nr:hypothetical protein M422DRAFT_254056 [Sphaerobolus stellatus SS14]
MDGLHEAWSHIKLEDEKADNCRLCSDMDDLDEKIQELEARLLSLQPKTPTGERSLTVASTTNTSSSDISPHPLASPGDRTFSCKQKRPDYWLLCMWNTLKDWHTNPMSVPNTIRDDHDGYFLEEDIDIAAWISKVSVDISCPAFMTQMKAVFGSRDNFDMAFSGFSKNLLRADHEGRTTKTQTTQSEKIPTGPDFLALVLEHCSLTREQICSRIIPYMIRHEAKHPCSGTGTERAAYMHLNQFTVIGARPTPAKTGESSRQRLDADLETYNQDREAALPYDEAPPTSEPETGDNVPPPAGTNSTLHNECTMDIDQEFDDIYS